MLNWIDQRVPVRYLAFFATVALWVLSALQLVVGQASFSWVLLLTLLVGLGVHDLQQTRHAILRNYPIIGHFRFLLEFIRPELRQYFIEGDGEAVPFSRSQRSLVYARAKGESDKRPFGTQMNVREPGYEWLTHSVRPSVITSHDFRVSVGGAQCLQPYSISLFNVSAMSFGALSANAIMALNLGAKKGGFAHDTGEGSISRYHREHGGDLIWEIGSGYFGCRNDDGTFSADRFKENAQSPQVKMIEIKLSQGAKPGHGGVLPGPKVTPEIAEARGVPVGVDCVSPAAHTSFDSPLGLIEFVQTLRELSGGKPVGFKLCIGHPWEWFGMVKAMLESGIRPDFVVVDGAEGGTGAAPLEFSDHMGMPLQEALRLVPKELRNGALALGAPAWRAFLQVTLPAASSGIVTAVLLGVARVIGETAPLILTTFSANNTNLNIFEGGMSTLPTYLYNYVTMGFDTSLQRAWGAALVILILVGVLFAAARFATRSTPAPKAKKRK